MATPYMSLDLPVVSVTLGPEWATELNAALEVIDEHDHTSGKGRAITTAALDIDADLEMNGFRLQNIPSLQVNSLGAPVSGVGFENSISSDTGDLYWTNGAGVPVQITSGGAIVSSPAAMEVIQYDVVAADLIIGSGDPYVFVSVNTSAPRTITLPLSSSVASGRLYVVKDATGDSESNTLTIVPSGADTIDGEASVTITSEFGAVFLVGNGVDGYEIF